ncbi:hypothetical protein BDV19DRAFT_374926 [Aspergillus venezuelensis]
MPLSELCPRTNQPHGNAWSCGSCLATTSRTRPCTEPRHTEPRRTEIEVIDLLDSSPLSSPSPQKAIHVFATPPKQLSTQERFKHYNRTEGAEDYRQESITRTRTVGIQGTTVNVHFQSLVRKRLNGILKPLSCDFLDNSV